MKRIFTYAALAIATLSASATDYTGQLKVNVDGMVLPEAETTVTINKNENQTYALELNNLILTMGGAPAGIGNLVDCHAALRAKATQLQRKARKLNV